MLQTSASIVLYVRGMICDSHNCAGRNSCFSHGWLYSSAKKHTTAGVIPPFTTVQYSSIPAAVK